MPKSLKELLFKKDLILDALSTMDLQALKSGKLFLTPSHINDYMLKLVALPSFIQSLIVGFEEQSVVLDVKVPILPSAKLKLDMIAYKFDQGEHYIGFSYGGKNNFMAVKVLIFLVQKMMEIKKVAVPFVRLDTDKQEIWLTLDHMPQFKTLMNLSFEEGTLNNLLIVKSLSMSIDGVALDFSFKGM